MEIDVASIDTARDQTLTTPTTTTILPEAARRPSKPHPRYTSSREQRRRKSESSSTSTALKSILRQRSDLASECSPALKSRRKRVVKFCVEDRRGEPHRWSDKRLRYLALDLDRWDNLPHAVLRSLNKQKTRHTRRLKCCSSYEDVLTRHGKAARPHMDDGASLKSLGMLSKKESDHRTFVIPDIPETVPEMESIEKSYFVTRWLQQSSRNGQSDPLHDRNTYISLTGNSTARTATTTTTTTTAAFNPSFNSHCPTPHPLIVGFAGQLDDVVPEAPLVVSPPGVTGVPSSSLHCPQVTPASPAALPSFASYPAADSSLQSLSVNFHTLTLQSSSSSPASAFCRHE